MRAGGLTLLTVSMLIGACAPDLPTFARIGVKSIAWSYAPETSELTVTMTPDYNDVFGGPTYKVEADSFLKDEFVVVAIGGSGTTKPVFFAPPLPATVTTVEKVPPGTYTFAAGQSGMSTVGEPYGQFRTADGSGTITIKP